MQKDLEILKKHFGEKFAHLCRTMFPQILDVEGLLSKIILEHIAPSKTLVDDLENIQNLDNFKNYIYNFVDVEKDRIQEASNKTPEQILDEAGYTLYKCETEEEIQAFKKYYAPTTNDHYSEALCTFNGGRLNHRYVFWIVKKNVDEIKRENFKSPQREDEYSTSVLSIQFDKGTRNRVEIISRYNHNVNNPNSTYNNNLDNIAPRLTQAFEQTYGFNVLGSDKSPLTLPNFVLASDGKYYKFNVEKNGQYYCENNVIIKENGNVVTTLLDTSQYLVFDTFVLDKKLEKRSDSMNTPRPKLFAYDDSLQQSKKFVDIIGRIDKVNVVSEKDEQGKKTGNQIISILNENGFTITIKIDKHNRMIEYCNPEIVDVPDAFLQMNKYLKKVSLPNAKTCGSNCFINCESLEEVEMPNVTTIGHHTFSGSSIKHLSLPNLEKIGVDCIKNCPGLETVNLPKLQKMGDSNFNQCSTLTSVYLPSLTEMGVTCFQHCFCLKSIDLPLIITIPSCCFKKLDTLQKINLPKVETLEGGNFVSCGLSEIELPNVTKVGGTCFANYEKLKKVTLPKAKTFEAKCFYSCYNLEEVNLPAAETFGYDCFWSCLNLETLNLPNTTFLGAESIYNCQKLKTLTAPKLNFVGAGSIQYDRELEELYLPELTTLSSGTIRICPSLKKVHLPKLKTIYSNTLYQCPNLETLEFEELTTCPYDVLIFLNNLTYFYAHKLESKCPDKIEEIMARSQVEHDAKVALNNLDSRSSDVNSTKPQEEPALQTNSSTKKAKK